MKRVCSIRLSQIEQVRRFPVIASEYESDILLTHDKYVIDGTSLMGIISLNLSAPIDVCIIEKREGEAEKLYNQLKQEGFEVTE